jgi:hypothetical protein
VPNPTPPAYNVKAVTHSGAILENIIPT